MQATLELMAQNFPGAFSGYQLSVKESHQRTKVDTSGTAKEIVKSFQKLGTPFEVVSGPWLCTVAGVLRKVSLNDRAACLL